MYWVVGLHFVLVVVMLVTGISKMYHFFDERFPFPVHIMFWGNIIAPSISLLWTVVCSFVLYLAGSIGFSILNIIFVASVSLVQKVYNISVLGETVNLYLLFLVGGMVFIVACIIYLAGIFVEYWKKRFVAYRYSGINVFFFGQIISKLKTTTQTMTLICLTFLFGIGLFLLSPVLSGWSLGYLDMRSLYDIQVSTQYQKVYNTSDLPTSQYPEIDEFLQQHNIQMDHDLILNLYLPKQEDFHNRNKLHFPILAISLSDYNAMRQMLGYPIIQLAEDEFTTHWHSVVLQQEREEFLQNNAIVSTDIGDLHLAQEAGYSEPIGENMYSIYTDAIYIFPDAVCQNLLEVGRNRYIKTKQELSYADTLELEQQFNQAYPFLEEKPGYYIRTRIQQKNSGIASNFVLEATMQYAGIVLLVSCLTILALQQLSDASKYKYRFDVMKKLGADTQQLNRVILKQLGIWFGLPIVTAIFLSTVVLDTFCKVYLGKLLLILE